MLTASGTANIIRLVTASAVTIDARVEAVDYDVGATTVTPQAGASIAITTATTTTLVAAPGASKIRNALGITLKNKSASASSIITVQAFDGTTPFDLYSVNLLAGEHVTLNEAGNWRHYDASGAEYLYTGPALANLGPTGTIAETMPRETCPETNTVGPGSGVLWLQAIYLKAGQTLNSIELWSATTAAVTPTNQMAGLFDGNRNPLAQAANRTTEAWAANTAKLFPLTAPYRVSTNGLYYIGFFVTATTMPTFKGGTAKTGGQLAAAVPILQGTSSTALTTALPNPAAVITASTGSIYARVT